MYTNQTASPGDTRVPAPHCSHPVGEATRDTCQYLRALERLHDWVEHARGIHQSGRWERELMGRLWQIQAELSYALDHCPNHPVPPDVFASVYATSEVTVTERTTSWSSTTEISTSESTTTDCSVSDSSASEG